MTGNTLRRSKAFVKPKTELNILQRLSLKALAINFTPLAHCFAVWHGFGQSNNLVNRHFPTKHVWRSWQPTDMKDSDAIGMKQDAKFTRRYLLPVLASAAASPQAVFVANAADLLDSKGGQIQTKKANGSMRAVVRQKGMVYLDNYPKPPMPKQGSEEVLVRVRGAAINPIDYKAPKSILGEVVGIDFAGVVEAVAEGSPKHGFKVGDEVYGMTSGSLAEFSLVADGGRLAHKPPNLSFAQAAALPVVYLTGLQALRDYGGLRQGGRVLVIGASGGTGLAGVQLAKCLGATKVVGVCSPKNREIVLRSGADIVVDYTKDQVSEVFRNLPDEEKFDVVYDCASGSGAGEDYQSDARQVLKEASGQYVPINGGILLWLRYLLKIQAKGTHLFLTDANRRDLEIISNLLQTSAFGEKVLEPIIATTLPFTANSVAEGFALLKSRRTVGKIAFDVA